MSSRALLFVVCVSLSLLATSRRAGASTTPAQSSLFRPLPPRVETKPNPILAAFERLGRSCHRATFAMRERGNDPWRQERDAATSLGTRPPGVSALGASAAAIGASVWIFSRRGGSPPPVVVGPRLYPGGGGMGLYVRW